ncbi:GNAT family N-acetyltransferase [Gottfriedia acidiceleris]|uniref:GNAT family N-acetyltransferase n=1 Tax=Bacillaceae TaxID=186817 RepID=UPI000BEB74DC|nr:MULTISPECIES: GNAT family N-acetyltransferase [unclassified Bacillus (in: firmicutes)]PEC47432.1 GNAT family N-acetyltransferase [Bacillus sp. AFS096315]PFM78614.1 GNAT family N-acetyltransferase [Bacillus sp. AFS077874]
MEVLIRPVEINDAKALHRICTQENVFPYMIFLPSMRVDMMENRIRNLQANEFEFVAECNGDVVGLVGLVKRTGHRSHVGDLFIATDGNHHNKGIGKALLTKVLDLADHWLMLERVELGVLETNPKAQALYEKFGFKVEGVKKGNIKANGRFVDEIMMCRFRPDGIIQ